ncbi:histidinol phosphatase [Chitinophaga silvatica]|uniref:protein-tyrosine-phosphatase n=1 Tax=Chitinophaga silvatica TaxID=2282649 RepID=A0A3E1Y9G0_9BACT|nr:CpsB/CapC family capsule biosynthesis tyrosine phosphatase [Chitinophaga silvatica]RFS22030.1 histidinol phosphatase [Chitinophaga silvatica]
MQTDIHSHLLPGVDDGSQDLQTSLFFIEKLQELGISRIITTPHIMMDRYPNSVNTLQSPFESVYQSLKDANNNISFKYAAEYYLDEQFVPLLQQPLLTITGNKVLVEISFVSAPPQLHQWLFDIQAAGYQPILAHPERYGYYHNEFNQYHLLKELGCQLQVNLLSLTGYYGKGVQKAATLLLEQQLADFIGTDLHHEKHLHAIIQISNNNKLRKTLDEYPFKNNTLTE